MNKNKYPTNKFMKKFISSVSLAALLLSTQSTASAAILFQDDTFDEVMSDAIKIGTNDAGAVNTAIQFGNDVTGSENGVINWNITSNTFEFDHSVSITGGISATGSANFSGTSQMRLRENANPTANSACAVVGEVIINTTAQRLEICTVTGGAGAATWTAPAATNADLLDGLDSAQFLRSDASDNFTSGTLTTDSGTTLDVNGVFDASGATRFAVRSGAANPGTCTEGDLFYNTTTNLLLTCTATDTWSTNGVDDFESVYAADGDDTLTTGGGNFTIATGNGNVINTLGSGEFDITTTGLLDFNAANFDVDTTAAITLDAGAASNLTTSAGDLTLAATAGSAILNGGEAAADAVRINASNAGGGIDADAGTAGITFDSTGALSFDGVGASNFTTASGALTLSTTTTGAVNVTAADNVNLTSGAGDDVTIVSGDDITFDDAQLGTAIQLTNAATAWAATLGGGGIVDNINSFTTTNAGEGASNVGINDAGSYFTGTEVEAALQELGAVTGANAPNNGVLSFYPEFPDTVIFPDGTNNVGTLQSLYDDTNDQHYYGWTSNNATTQDMDLRFRFSLPADFSDVNDFTYSFRTGTTTEADNDVEYRVFNATNETAGDPTLCGSDTTNTSANAWTAGTITEATLETGCTGATALNAGDVIEVAIKLLDNSGAGDFANVGIVALGYDN
ncbi:MAG: beta strand repeat-containing protein [Candidatus Altimarinota bacterium]